MSRRKVYKATRIMYLNPPDYPALFARTSCGKRIRRVSVGGGKHIYIVMWKLKSEEYTGRFDQFMDWFERIVGPFFLEDDDEFCGKLMDVHKQLIEDLHAQGYSNRIISGVIDCHPNMVQKYLAAKRKAA